MMATTPKPPSKSELYAAGFLANQQRTIALSAAKLGKVVSRNKLNTLMAKVVIDGKLVAVDVIEMVIFEKTKQIHHLIALPGGGCMVVPQGALVYPSGIPQDPRFLTYDEEEALEKVRKSK